MTAKSGEIVIPDNASLDEYKVLLDDVRAKGAGLETILAILDKIKLIEERFKMIARIENFKPVQAKLYVRRATEEDILKVVPDEDVVDDIVVQEIKRVATGNKRIFTSDEELKSYQVLKAAGVTDFIYDKENERVIAKVPVADVDGANAGEETDKTAPEVEEEEAVE